jgi:nitrogen regulatory protein PII
MEGLAEVGVFGLTVSEVQGFGRQGGKSETFRGSEYQLEFVPKLKVEVLVPSESSDEVVAAIVAASRTDSIGDGKLWVTELDGITRIRTGEIDDASL